MTDLLWQSKAECAKSEDADLWFSDRDETKKIAKEICWGKCPVRVQCLAYAQRVEFAFGIYGGYTPKERWELRNALIRERQAQISGALTSARS